MSLLKQHKLPFGISTCYTSKNVDDVSSEEFFDLMIDSGALFVWFFHYMPIGNDAVVDLLPTPEQRELMYNRIRVPQDEGHFQHGLPNAEFMGCIAGGRSYLHINAKGDVGNVCLSTIPTPISMKFPCWMLSRVLCLWHTMTNSLLMTTCCALPHAGEPGGTEEDGQGYQRGKHRLPKP